MGGRQRRARCRSARYAVSRKRWKLARMKNPPTCCWKGPEKVGGGLRCSAGSVTVSRPRSSICGTERRCHRGVRAAPNPPPRRVPPLLTCCWMLEERLAASNCSVSTNVV